MPSCIVILLAKKSEIFDIYHLECEGANPNRVWLNGILHGARSINLIFCGDQDLSPSEGRELNSLKTIGADIAIHRIGSGDRSNFGFKYMDLFEFVRNLSQNVEKCIIYATKGTALERMAIQRLMKKSGPEFTVIELKVPDRTVSSSHSLLPKEMRVQRRTTASELAEIPDDVGAPEILDRLGFSIDRYTKGTKGLVDALMFAHKLARSVLLTGDAGTGKTTMAHCIHALWKQRGLVAGDLIELDCSTIRDDAHAVEALCWVENSPSSTQSDSRDGILRRANGGVLHLTNIDRLPLTGQIVIRQSFEYGHFYGINDGLDQTVSFCIIAESRLSLGKLVRQGNLDPGIYSLISVWYMELPSFTERRDDIESIVERVLWTHGETDSGRVCINSDAKSIFINFCRMHNWVDNWRGISRSVLRMVSLSRGRAIDEAIVADEITRLVAGD